MTLLVLSGTREGRDIAAALHRQGIGLIASLAGATRSPRAQEVPTRVGGFGGADGFRQFLKDSTISAVLDATHPFASEITARTAQICGELNIPYCLFTRPEWIASEGDNWTKLDDEQDAANYIEPASIVFLATGRKTLERFENLSSCKLICRQIDPPNGPFPFPNGEFLIGRPPFSVEDEIALFKSLGVDWLIVKNAGGNASFSKLDAARTLGIRVGMIKRPALPEARSVSTIEQAIDWGSAHG
ncbi:MAG: cobalt-precorrin-6A reductase [Planktotalea sp.]|uniref:cobalt-precorrin-6A reductase n=1 Tax=Planktotalea sp. TaxID=2029877 RepID=UPI003C71662A